MQQDGITGMRGAKDSLVEEGDHPKGALMAKATVKKKAMQTSLK